MRRGLVQSREADELMTNAAHMQRCVDMPLDETPTKHGSRQQLRVPPACGSRSRRTQSASRPRSRRLGECRHLCENAPRRFEDEKTVRWKSNSYTNTCTIMFSLTKCQVQRMRLSSATAHRIACERGVTGLQTGTRAHLRHAETSA